MSPLDYYQQQLAAGNIQADSHQLSVVHRLQALYLTILRQQKYRSSPWRRWLRWFKPRINIGLYLWGQIGVGKTYLMNIFYHCLPQAKLRMHFHAFMQYVHKGLRQYQGLKNPLQKIAQDLSDRATIICLDEMQVHDIADAMLLGGLLSALLKAGIFLVTTSNSCPDELYADGLQRENFLPTIAQIKRCLSIVAIVSQYDYRRRPRDINVCHYFTPLSQKTAAAMQHTFKQLTHNAPIAAGEITLYTRALQYLARYQRLIWFDFHSICTIPRSRSDYLALAEQYVVWMISGVPVIPAYQHSWITNFIHLVDVCYDHAIPLVISAATPPAAIYPEGKQHTLFQRTVSRLIEMQSWRLDKFIQE